MIPTLIGGVSSQLVFGLASGGTLSTISNYNGTGQTWNVHTFTSNGTFTVTRASAFGMRVLTVGGGGNGGCGGPYFTAGGRGGRGQPTHNASVSVPIGAHSVTVGGVSGSSSLGSLQTSSGGGAGGNHFESGGVWFNGTTGSPDYASISNNITGTSVNYSAGVGSPNGSQCLVGGNGPLYGGAGGGGGGDTNELCGAKCGGSGAQGIVIISYRIT